MPVTFTAADFERQATHFYKAYAGDLSATICGGYCVRSGILFAWAICRDDTMIAQGANLSMEEAIESINAAQGVGSEVL